MSLFLLTNSYKKAEKAFSIWDELFDTVQTQSLNDEHQLITTSGFKDSEGFSYFKYPEGEVYGFGTFFDSKGFRQHIDANANRLINFDQRSVHSLFGHYAFIIRKDDAIRVVTDPIGIINIFWAQTDQSFFISNDCLLVAALSGNDKISKNSSLQFIFDKFTHGSATFFKHVKRLKFGHQLLINKDKLKEESFHRYIPEKLNFNEYIECIDSYFDKISTYKGRIISDISAGHDSRLVTACAAKYIPDLLTCTNDTRTDDGADLTYGKIISDALNLRHHVLTNDKKSLPDQKTLLHTFTPEQNIKTAERNFWKNQKRYKFAGLNLVGQNVEMLRGDYPPQNTLNKLVNDYFSGKVMLRFGNTPYLNKLTDCLRKEYIINRNFPDDRLNAWIYLTDFAPNLCAPVFSGKLLFGDVLSPFLDWHLINPILKWDKKEIESKQLYFNILKRYHPTMADLPINPEKNDTKSNSGTTSIWKKAGQKILTYLPNKQCRKRREIIREQYEILAKDKFDPKLLFQLEITLRQLEKYSKNHELERIGRLATIQIAKQRVLDISG